MKKLIATIGGLAVLTAMFLTSVLFAGQSVSGSEVFDSAVQQDNSNMKPKKEKKEKKDKKNKNSNMESNMESNMMMNSNMESNMPMNSTMNTNR